ncbi:hypothetical protein IT575_05760 [bacterium]|nr:hypothetical protein [bacterium]
MSEQGGRPPEKPEQNEEERQWLELLESTSRKVEKATPELSLLPEVPETEADTDAAPGQADAAPAAEPSAQRKVAAAMQRSASGLEEEAIAAQDLRELQELLKVRSLQLPAASAELRSLCLELLSPQLHEVMLTLAAPKTLKLRLVPLPQKARVHKVAPELSRPKLHHSLELIQRQPVRRRRLNTADLNPAEREALARALLKQFGQDARSYLPVGIFAHVPPELKDGLRLSSDGNSLGIVLPRGFNAARASSGHYLVLLQEREKEQAETRRILLRL